MSCQLLRTEEGLCKDYANFHKILLKTCMTNALIIKYSLKTVQWQLVPKGGTRIISMITQPFRNKSVIFQGHLIDLFFISVKL